MTLNFYELQDDPRVVNKNLGSPTKNYTNVYLKDAQDLINPTFILNTTVEGGKYCYCPEFKRYYFVNDITFSTGGKTEISCTEDVLMTYKDEIMNTEVIVFKQGSDALADRLIADNRIPLQVNTESRTYNFKDSELGGATISSYAFVLNCFGGKKGTT